MAIDLSRWIPDESATDVLDYPLWRVRSAFLIGLLPLLPLSYLLSFRLFCGTGTETPSTILVVFVLAYLFSSVWLSLRLPESFATQYFVINVWAVSFSFHTVFTLLFVFVVSLPSTALYGLGPFRDTVLFGGEPPLTSVGCNGGYWFANLAAPILGPGSLLAVRRDWVNVEPDTDQSKDDSDSPSVTEPYSPIGTEADPPISERRSGDWDAPERLWSVDHESAVNGEETVDENADPTE